MLDTDQGYISYSNLQRMSSAEVLDYLEQSGVKGMKWGERRAHKRELTRKFKAKDAVRKQRELVTLSKQHAPNPKHAVDREKYKQLKNTKGKVIAKAAVTREIDRARSRVNSGAFKASFKVAKMQRSKDKINKGSKEARRIFKEKKKLLRKDYALSRQAKNGKEVALTLLLGNSYVYSQRD